jgi:hypothetical protein
MNYPWSIYPNLWQNSDFLTTQSLTNLDTFFKANWQFYFQNTPIGKYWGVHQLQYNLNQISQGKIIIESIQCTFPNGQNFSYNSQWKKFNGNNFISNDNDCIYSLECNLQDFSMFFSKPWIEIGLVLQSNSFQQENFITVATETRDVNDLNDVSMVNVRMPIVQLTIQDLIKNNNNYIPLFRINCENQIFTLLEYQYPIHTIGSNGILGQQIDQFINQLYEKIIYIHKEAHDDNHVGSFLQILMAYVFPLKSLLANDILTVDHWFKESLTLLGQMESFLNFNCKSYYLFPKDLLTTHRELVSRINEIFQKFYQVGNWGSFVYDGSQYSIAIDFVWDDGSVYLDFSAPIEKNDLVNWVESSLITESNDIDNQLVNKTRGLERTLMDSKTNNNNHTWLRYSLDNIHKYPHKLIVFNPIVIHQLTINLIKKS